MTLEALDAAATVCPACHARTLPDPVVYSVVACYTCVNCGAEWSARLRNGRPDVRLYPASTIARVADAAVSPLSEFPRHRPDLEHRDRGFSTAPKTSYDRMR